MLGNGYEACKSAATNTQHVLIAAHVRTTRELMRTLEQTLNLKMRARCTNASSQPLANACSRANAADVTLFRGATEGRMHSSDHATTPHVDEDAVGAKSSSADKPRIRTRALSRESKSQG